MSTKADIEKIKDHIDKINLSEEEKSNSYKLIEEWYQEDKALDELFVELSELSEKIKEYFAELGII